MVENSNQPPLRNHVSFGTESTEFDDIDKEEGKFEHQ